MQDPLDFPNWYHEWEDYHPAVKVRWIFFKKYWFYLFLKIFAKTIPDKGCPVYIWRGQSYIDNRE